MTAARPFKVSLEPLEVAEAVSLLENPPEDAICDLPPVKPKAGEIYIYRNENKGKLYSNVQYLGST